MEFSPTVGDRVIRLALPGSVVIGVPGQDISGEPYEQDFSI